MKQVRQEIAKVTWPSRRETVTTTIMVFIMVFICAIFFLVIDWAISGLIKLIFGIGV